MNPELFMVFLPGASWILFSLGGTQISKTIPGWKGWRRFILPAIFSLAVALAHRPWWAYVGTGLLTFAAYTLPYGEKVSWVGKALVGVGYALLSVFVGLSLWNAITAVSFVGLFALSNTRLSADLFPWKICEGFFGLFVGIQLAYQLMR